MSNANAKLMRPWPRKVNPNTAYSLLIAPEELPHVSFWLNQAIQHENPLSDAGKTLIRLRDKVVDAIVARQPLEDAK